MQLDIKWDLTIVHNKIGKGIHQNIRRGYVWVVGIWTIFFNILFGCNVFANSQIYLY